MSVAEKLFACLSLLLLGAMLVHQLYIMVVDWRFRLSERALEAADEGKTQEVLRLLRRMREKAARHPSYPTPESIAASLVFKACEWGHPETAQAVLDYLGLRRAQLMWEEEGKPAVPFLEYARQEPDFFAHTIAFLTQQDS